MSHEILDGLAVIVNEVAGVPVADIQSDKSFIDDLDIDSLSMVEVVMAAEDKWGVKIPDSEVKNLRTVGDAVAYIEKSTALPCISRSPASVSPRPWGGTSRHPGLSSSLAGPGSARSRASGRRTSPSASLALSQRNHPWIELRPGASTDLSNRQWSLHARRGRTRDHPRLIRYAWAP